MGDADRNPNRYHYSYIHNVFASFYKDVLEYFAGYLQPRFEYTVVSTYDKAVEFITKKDQYDREIDRPDLPALILNPSGDFGISENGGKQMWRFPNLAPALIKRLFTPVYQDSNMLITVGFSRFKGEIEIISLLPSVYEYMDTKVLFTQIFGGENRYIYPQYFDSVIIIPDALYNYTYTNQYTGVHYKINWDSAGATQQLIKTTNQNEYVLPVHIKPIFKLTGMSDGSEKYGGTDKLASWRFVANIEYEVEMPTYMILESDYLAENIQMTIKFGSAYSAYSNHQPPINRNITKTSWDWGLDETSNSEIDLDRDTTCEIEYVKHLVFKTRYYHIVTASEAASKTNIYITLPETILDKDNLLVNSRYGTMNYGDHYIIIDDGTRLEIKVEDVTLIVGQVIELYVYNEDIGE